MFKKLKGVIRMHPRGFGFVIPNDPSDSDQDIFIPKHLINFAVDGDQVEVHVDLQCKSHKGPEGEIVSIVKRSKLHLVGTIESIEDKKVLAYIPLMSEQHRCVIQMGRFKHLKPGDRCVFSIQKWGKRNQPTICKVVQKIGHINNPSCDVEAAIEEHALKNHFPSRVIEEAKFFGSSVLKKDFKERIDLTQLPCVTIDPETAKDFDDALSIEKNPQGYLLTVHIADVAHYVKEGSALDLEAKERCNSVYFPGSCVPMLPEQLSNNLCSLKQGVNRLAVSVSMQFDKKGDLRSSKIRRTVIKSRKRFTYEEALSILQRKKKSTHSTALQHMFQLCQLLKQKRTERGSIDFAVAELILIIDKKGMPTGTKIEPYHIAHQLVEEFMLKTNEVIATHLETQNKQQLFRIHEKPNTENLEAFFATARALGFNLPKTPTQQDLQKLFEKVKQTPFAYQIAVGFIRNLKLAFYSPQNIGHYGLALERYCHFTSPIRRYSDLVSQRLLFEEELSNADLQTIGKQCSEKERISSKAEAQVKLLKKLRLLKVWLEEDPQRIYKGYISKIKPFGLYFEIHELHIEGFLHVSKLKNDYFIYDEKIPLLFGENTGKKHKIGQEIEVKVTRVDLIHLETQWEIPLVQVHKRRGKKSK